MGDQFFDRRTSPNFPNRFSTLPNISGDQNQIALQSSIDNKNDRDQLSNIEQRLQITEKSNRSLLEEIVRLRSDIKLIERKTDKQSSDEGQNRGLVQNAVRVSQEALSDLQQRMIGWEERNGDDRATISSLLSHVKTMEQNMLGMQKELLQRKNDEGSKIAELKNQMIESERSKQLVENALYTLSDQVRQLKSKQESYLNELASNVGNLKNKARKLEDEHQLTMDTSRRQTETTTQLEQTQTQLKMQIEARLSELRDVLVEMRSKVDKENQDRIRFEQQTALRMAELNTFIKEQDRKRDDALSSLDRLQREKQQFTETEKLRMQAKIMELNDDFSKKLGQKEIRLREEIHDKTANLQNILEGEIERRNISDKEMRNELEKEMQDIKRITDQEAMTIKDLIKNDKQRQNQGLKQLNQSVDLLDKQLDEQKRLMKTIMAAEIESRNKKERKTLEDMDALEKKFKMMVGAMQDSMSALNAKVEEQSEKMKEFINRFNRPKSGVEEGPTNDDLDKIKDAVKLVAEQVREDGMKSTVDLEGRVVALSSRITKMEDDLDIRITNATELQEASSVQAKNLREKMDSLWLWQESINQTLKELSDKNVLNLEEVLRTEIDSKITAESVVREKQIEELKGLEKSDGEKPPPSDVSKEDLENCQKGIRKLAESIQTVKTVLGMKIQSEQKLRESAVTKLTTDMKTIEDKTAELEEKKADKPDDKKEDDDKDKKDDDDKDPKDDDSGKDDDKGGE